MWPVWETRARNIGDSAQRYQEYQAVLSPARSAWASQRQDEDGNMEIVGTSFPAPREKAGLKTGDVIVS